MLKVWKNKRLILINLAIWLSFLLLSGLYVAIFLKNGLIMVGSDRMFHLERMEEAYQNLRQGHLISYISTFSFARIGQAIGTFYPSLNLPIYGLIHLIVKNEIHAAYAFIMLEQFIGLTIAYYSGKVLLKKRTAAYLFAIILRFSNYVLYNDFPRFDVGESWSLVFMPMTLAGLYIILNDNQWKGSIIMALGLVLEISCHILTNLITIVFIVSCYVIYFFTVSKSWQKLYKLIWSAIIFIFGSLFVLVPIISSMLANSINKPDQGPLSGYNFPLGKLLGNSLNNALQMDAVNIGTILLVALVVGFAFMKYESRLMNCLYLGAVLLVVLSTSLFPWQLFSKTSLATLQYPWRLLSIVIVLLSLYAADILAKSSHSWISVGLTLILSMTLMLGAQQSFIAQESSKFTILQNSSQVNSAWGLNLDKNSIEQVKSKNLSNSVSSRSLDYLPVKAKKNSQDIFGHVIRVNGHKERLHNWQIKSGYQSVSYQLNLTRRKEVLDLPFLIYNRQNYRLYQDGREVPFSVSGDSTVQVKKPDGISHVCYRVKFHTPTLWTISSYLSFISIIASLLWLLWSPRRVNS